MARRPDRRRTAAIRRVNLQGLGPSTPIKLANSNTSAEPECLQNAAISAFSTGDELPEVSEAMVTLAMIRLMLHRLVHPDRKRLPPP